MTNRDNEVYVTMKLLRAKGYSFRAIGYLVGGLTGQAVQQRLAKYRGLPLKIEVDHKPTKEYIWFSTGTEDWLLNNFKPVDKQVKKI